MSRINLMNAIRSFHIDKKTIVKIALASDVKCKNWGKDRTFEILQDFDNIISASLEKEIDEALAGNTKPTLARFKELANYGENKEAVAKKYSSWEYDFLRYIKYGDRKNALLLATHLKQCLIFYSLDVDKEHFTRNTILECIQFTEAPKGINEEYYYTVKQKMREERISTKQVPSFEEWMIQATGHDKHKEKDKEYLTTYYRTTIKKEQWADLSKAESTIKGHRKKAKALFLKK